MNSMKKNLNDNTHCYLGFLKSKYFNQIQGAKHEFQHQDIHKFIFQLREQLFSVGNPPEYHRNYPLLFPPDVEKKLINSPYNLIIH
jgi:hypothetical protein